MKFDSSKLTGASTIILALLMLITIFPQVDFAVVGQTCTLSADCGFGEICGACEEGRECASRIEGFSGGQCAPCKTSAECVQKTFDKSVPYLGAMSPWVVISLLAVLISFLGAGLVYVIGHAFNVRRIKQAGRAEIFQAIASLILIGLLFGTEQFEIGIIEQLEQTSGAITAAIYQPTAFQIAANNGVITSNPFEISYGFIHRLLDCGKRQYDFAYSSSVASEYISNLKLQFSLKIPVLKHLKTPVTPLAQSNSKIVAEKEYLADELTWLMTMLYAQLALMKFIEASMFTIFLPIGIILRAFPPTRGAGAVLMAIAIGLYVVYPLVFTLLYVGTPPVLEGCNVAVPPDYNQIKRVCPLAVGSTTKVIDQAQTTTASFELNFPRVKSGATSLRFSAFLYMIISLGATFIFIRSIAGILGANISEIGRSMFRML